MIRMDSGYRRMGDVPALIVDIGWRDYATRCRNPLGWQLTP